MRSGTVRNRSCGPGGAKRTLRIAGPSSLPSVAVALDGTDGDGGLDLHCCL